MAEIPPDKVSGASPLHHWSLRRAAELLRRYAAVVRDCHSSERERFDYLPEIEDAARDVDAAAQLVAPSAEVSIWHTFRKWWHERGGKLPHDATKKEVAMTAWSAAMESRHRLADTPSAKEEFTQALRFVDAIEAVAFEMRAPNPFTPRIVQLCNTLRHILRSPDSRGPDHG